MNQSGRKKIKFVATLPVMVALLLGLFSPRLVVAQSEKPVLITDVIVNRSNIFDADADSPNRAVQQSAQLIQQSVNRFHRVTLESVIRRAIDIAPGDMIRPADVEEIERRLRNLGIFASVGVALVTGDAGVELHVTTRDTFSIAAGLTGSFLGGVGNLGFTAGENNLLGTGNKLRFGFARASDDGFRGSITFTDLHFFDRPWRANYAIGRTSDGNFFSAGLSDRFRTLSDNHEWSVTLDYREFINDFYLNGDIVFQVPEERARFIAKQVWRSGETDRFFRKGLELRLLQSEYSQTAGAFGGITRPVDTRTLYLGGLLARDTINGFKKVQGLDTLNFVQDIRLGTTAQMELGINLEDDFNTEEDLQVDPAVSVVLSKASALGEHSLVNMAIGANALFEEAGDRAWNTTARIAVYNTALDKLTLAFNADYITGEDGSDLPVQLTLGEGNGLRGYDSRQFQGRQRLRTNLEGRYNAGWKLAFLDIGIVGFFDAGWAAARGDSSPSIAKSVGAGLRLGSNSLFGARVFRIDLSFPLDAPDGEDSNPSLSAALGQVFRF